MIKLFTYKSILRSFIYLLLIGQLWVSVGSYCHLIFDSEFELIELCENEKSENENENEKDKKLRFLSSSTEYDDSEASMKFLFFEDSLSIHYPESTTPPPEQLHV